MVQEPSKYWSLNIWQSKEMLNVLIFYEFWKYDIFQSALTIGPIKSSKSLVYLKNQIYVICVRKNLMYRIYFCEEYSKPRYLFTKISTRDASSSNALKRSHDFVRAHTRGSPKYTSILTPFPHNRLFIYEHAVNFNYVPPIPVCFERVRWCLTVLQMVFYFCYNHIICMLHSQLQSWK